MLSASHTSDWEDNKKLREISQQGADAIASSPPEALLLLHAFRIRRLGLLVGVLRVLLGLGRMLFSLGMITPAVGFRCGTMGLRCGLVMFRRFVVCVFHVDFSCWPENFGKQYKTPR